MNIGILSTPPVGTSTHRGSNAVRPCVRRCVLIVRKLRISDGPSTVRLCHQNGMKCPPMSTRPCRALSCTGEGVGANVKPPRSRRIIVGTGGGTRTLTPRREPDFESGILCSSLLAAVALRRLYPAYLSTNSRHFLSLRVGVRERFVNGLVYRWCSGLARKPPGKVPEAAGGFRLRVGWLSRYTGT